MNESGVRVRVREALAAALASSLLSAAFLHESLFDPGKALGGLDIPLSHSPWAPAHAGFRPRNPELADQALVFYPFLSFLHREWQEKGRLPLWNPHQFCGAPAAGNPQFGHFSPAKWLFLALPVERAFAIQAWLKLAVASLFAYLLARRLGASRAGGAVAGTAFGFGGYQVLWLVFPLSDVSCFVPAFLYFLETARRTLSVRALAAVALAGGFVFLGGHPETAFFAALLAGALVVAHAATRFREGGPRAAVRAGLPLLAAAFVGGLLAAVSILPAVEYLRASAAKALRAANLRPPPFFEGGLVALAAYLGGIGLVVASAKGLLRAIALPSVAAASIALGTGVWLALSGARAGGLGESFVQGFAPDFFGNPTWRGGYGGPAAYLQTAASYGGVLTLSLAAVAWISPGPRGSGFWKGTALASAALVWNAPLLAPALRRLPGLDLAEPSRAGFVFDLALALSAAWALTALARGEPGARRAAWGLLGAGGTLAGLILVAPPRPALPGPAPPLEGAEPTRRVFFRVVRSAGEEGRRFALEGAGELELGDRVDVTLDRGDGWAIRETASLRTVAGEHAKAAPFAGLLGFEFEPQVHRLPEGRYRVSFDVRDRAGAVVSTTDGGVVGLSRGGKVPLRSLVLAGAAAALLLGAASGRLRGILLGLAAFALSASDLALFGYGFNPAVPLARVVPPTWTETWLREDPDLVGPARRARIWTERGVLPPDLATRLGFLDVRGYDAIDLEAYDHFLAVLARDPNRFVGEWRLADLYTELPLFDLLGVKVVLSPEKFEDARFRFYREGEVRLYRNADFPEDGTGGIVFLAPQARWIHGPVRLEEADPRRVALVEETDVQIERPFEKGEARIVSHEPDRVVVRASLDGEGVLTLAENHFPGWTVEVNGKPERLLRAFATFRAVKLGPGDHEVVFRYRPLSVRVGAGVSLGALALVLVGLLSPFRRK